MSMRSPEEGPRKGLLFFRSTSAPTQERSSAVVMDPPKPYIEVEPEPQFQPQPEPPQMPEPQRTKKSLIRRLAQNLAVRLGFATLALSGSGYAAYQEIPAVHRTIDNVIGKVFGDEVPSAYDNAADEQTVKVGVNTAPITEQDVRDMMNTRSPLAGIDMLSQLKTGSPPKLEILFPIQGLKEGDSIRLSSIMVNAGDMGSVVETLQHTALIKQIDNIPQGKKIAMIVEGITKWDVFIAQGSKMRDVYLIGDLGNGTSVFVDLYSEKDVEDFELTDAIQSAPILDADKGEFPFKTKNQTKKKPITIDGDQAIFTSKKDKASLGIHAKIVSNGEWAYNSGPAQLQLATTANDQVKHRGSNS